MHITGVLLAAGAGVRFGGGKLSASLAGSTVGRLACANLVAAFADPIAVIRPGDEALGQELIAQGARVTVCPAAAGGMGESLSHGMRTALQDRPDAIVVALADMPWVSPQTYLAVRLALERGEPLVVPRVGKARGHPVGFGREHFAALLQLKGDAGARGIIEKAKRIAWLDVDDPGVLRDVDTRADLED